MSDIQDKQHKQQISFAFTLILKNKNQLVTQTVATPPAQLQPLKFLITSFQGTFFH